MSPPGLGGEAGSPPLLPRLYPRTADETSDEPRQDAHSVEHYDQAPPGVIDNRPAGLSDTPPGAEPSSTDSDPAFLNDLADGPFDQPPYDVISEEFAEPEIFDEEAPARIDAAVGEETFSPDATPARAQPTNQRIAPIEGRVPVREEDPYAPLGIRFGRFIVTSVLEQGLTWTSNADSSPDGSEATQSETTLRIDAKSDWSRHAATLEAYGRLLKPISGEEYSETDTRLAGTLRLDLTSEYTLLARLGYQVSPEDASSPVTIVDVGERPLLHTFDGSVEFAKILGKIRFNITGSATTDLYGDAILIDGTELPQGDRNNTLTTMRARFAYELSPLLIPFVEGEVGRRSYEDEADAFGYQRSATRLALRLGSAIDLREKLYGEASVGWISEDIDDERLDTISGLALTTNLNWSPERGTIVGLDILTNIEGTAEAGESGSIVHAATLRMEREVRSNLTAEARAGIAWRNYTSSSEEDLILSGQFGLTWWLNRNLGLSGRVRYERQTSEPALRDYDETSLFIGLKVQR